MSGTRRTQVKRWLDELEKEIPRVRSSLLGAMGRVHDRHLFPTEQLDERQSSDKSCVE